MRIFNSEGNVYEDYCTKMHGVTSRNTVSSLLLFHKIESYFCWLGNPKVLKASTPCKISTICVSKLWNGKFFVLSFFIIAGTVAGVLLH